MSRVQLAVTLSVIAAIIAFTVGVKIAASNTTPPKIVLPESVTAPVVRMPTEARVVPVGSAVVATAPAPQVPVAVEVAPPPVLPPLPVPPHEAGAPAPTPGPGGVPSPVPVPAPKAGGAAVAAMQQGVAPVIAPAVAPAPAPVAAAAVETPPAPTAAEPATPETDRREALEETRRAQTNGAVNSLLAIQRQLTTGDISGVDRALQSAAPAMNAVGQGALQQARQALANKDLAGAAQLINQAVLTASATPPVQ